VKRDWPAGQNANLQVRSVCADCNNGWMSALEQEARPILEPLIRSHKLLGPRTRDAEILSRWSMKTLMVSEAAHPSRAFFEASERLGLATLGQLPSQVKTVISLARSDGLPPLQILQPEVRLRFSASNNAKRTVMVPGTSCTLVLSSLVIQVAVLRIPASMNASPFIAKVIDRWSDHSLVIHPVGRASGRPAREPRALDSDLFSQFVNRWLPNPDPD